MSFMLPQMRSASEGQLADPYRGGSLGQKPRHLAKLLRERRSSHGFCSQVSCRLTDTGLDLKGKHEVHSSSPFIAYPFFLPLATTNAKRIPSLSDGCTDHVVLVA